LLAGRDAALGRCASASLLEDPALGLLSAVDIDLDRKLSSRA
jgi:hypothetical protein